MSKGIDYKQKYLELRARFVAATTDSFQMGYEKGYNEATVDAQAQQAQDQMAQAQAMQQQAMGMDGEGQEGDGNQFGNPNDQDQMQPGMDPQSADDAHMQAGATEIGGHLDQLDSLVNKNEKKTIKAADIAAILEAMKPSLRKITEAKQSTDLRRSMSKAEKNAKKHIARVNKTVKKFSKGYESNMTANNKKTLSMQETIVSDMMKKWDVEDKDVLSSIEGVLTTENRVKG